MFKTIPKISYSLIASWEKGELKDTLVKLAEIGIDMLHYDVSEQKKTLQLTDIEKIRKYTELPIDVHLAVKNPDKFISKNLKMHKNDYFCIHIENKFAKDKLITLKSQLGCRFGLSINIETPVEELSEYVHLLDYVLFMAAEPGISGASFNDKVIDKIQVFKKKYPEMQIHVDGGINNTTATLVRDIGVDVLISGSYILKDNDYANQVAKLVGQNLNLPVTAIMHSGDKLPVVRANCTINDIANEIDKKSIGCTCVIDENNKFAGIVTDTDIRRFLIRNMDFTGKTAQDIMNAKPKTVLPDKSVIKLLRELEHTGMIFSVLPVVDKNNSCVGILRLQDILFSNILGFRIRHL
ncbi:MAG: CBS domain-containing protein [Elusimicrobiota bacterium]